MKAAPARDARLTCLMPPWANVNAEIKKKASTWCMGKVPGLYISNGRSPTGLAFRRLFTLVLPVPGNKNAFIFMADKWDARHSIDSGQIWLPILFKDGKLVIAWQYERDLSLFNKKHD